MTEVSEIASALGSGIYPNLPIAEYEADPCFEPSLRASGIKKLLLDSPAAFAAYHPKLTCWPALLKQRTRRLDEGAVAHCLILGKGAEFIVAEPEDAPVRTEKGEPYKVWSGKALAWKQAKEAAGITFINEKQNIAAENTKQAAWNALTAEYGDYTIGDTEVTVIWQRDTLYGPIWCRVRLDLWALRFATIIDAKSTEMSTSDSALRYMAEYEGEYGMWYIQAAWQMEAIETILPKLAASLSYRWLVVQVVPPFGARLFDPRDGEINDWIDIGRQRNDRAANIFAKCLRAGDWPGHPRIARVRPSQKLMQRMIEEEERANGR